ncbi:hypothetical protein [uncultured Mediterranean phage uvMED]|jgi:hypothetical protein|nr:hypothetical protein [uncultured Mediterranean phage uvMED]|tara:strand:- start:470 stop:853 length:384 start_codon:yes stop_codon:yes gene_type:complete
MQNGKSKDWVLFPYDASNEKAIKIDFSGNTLLANGEKGTLLGSKGTSKDGNTKFIRIFAQVGVLFKGDDNKFTGNINAPEIGSSKKNLIGWLNDKSEKPNIAGYQNDPQDKPQQEQQQQPKDDALSF